MRNKEQQEIWSKSNDITEAPPSGKLKFSGDGGTTGSSGEGAVYRRTKQRQRARMVMFRRI